MNFKLKIWRQISPNAKGKFIDIQANDISESASFLEMIDIINERLVEAGDEPIAFDHDCREGICGTCSLVINGIPHGKEELVTTCQLHMRTFKNGDTITIEPYRARPFPVLKDLVTDRYAFDEIIQAGGYVSVRTGAPQDANTLPISKENADWSFDAAACIGCGACVAACKNASAMLFVSAKVSQLAVLPQGEPERDRRALSMVKKMDELGFGNCTNQFECEAVCPKGVSAANIALLNREYTRASVLELI